jgi:hypothetical protein
MLTPLDILDTAVKIGLGAGITGVSAFALASKQHRIDIAKERVKHRQQLLETVAQDVAVFTHITLKYWARMTNWIAVRDAGQILADDREAELQSLKDELFNAFEGMTASEGKLLLLGETGAQELLREYGELVGRFRAFASPENNPDVERSQLDDARRDMLAARNKFFAALSQAYRR